MAGQQVVTPETILRSQLPRYSTSSSSADSDWRVRDMQLSANGDLIAISGLDKYTGHTSIDLFRFNPGCKEEPKIIYSKEFSQFGEGESRYVSFLGDDEARLIVTCCDDQLELYNTGENGTRLHAGKIDGVAQCMTVREGLIYISLSQWSFTWVDVFDDDLNLIKTITLGGDHGWLQDITVTDSSRWFVCTESSEAMMYSASIGSPRLQYTKPGQFSAPSSITMSSELALVLVSWEYPTVITVHSLSDSHGSQVLFKFNHEDHHSMIRINRNRLVMIACRTGLISVYNMEDVLTYDNLKTAASVLLDAAGCERLSHFFALPEAQMNVITSSRTRVERVKSLLSLLEERSIVQSSDMTQFITALDEQNISGGLSAICKGYMTMRATRSDGESSQVALPGPSHRSPHVPSNSGPRKRSNPCELREEQEGISQKRKTSSFNEDEQAVLPGIFMQTVTQLPQNHGLPVPSPNNLSTPSPSISVPPATLQDPVVIPGLHRQPLQEISGLDTTPNTAVIRHQLRSSTTNSGRFADVSQSSSYDRQNNASNTVPSTSIPQEQVTISTNPTLLGRESEELDVGDHPIEWSGRDASHGQQTRYIGRFHQPWQNGADSRNPNGIGASPGSVQSFLGLLNDTCNSTRNIERQVQLPLTLHNSSEGGTAIHSQLQQTLRDSFPRKSANASSANVALTWAVPSPNLSLGSSIPQVYYYFAPKEAVSVDTSPATQESEPTGSPAPNRTFTSVQSNDSTNLAGNSIGCQDQLSSTLPNPSDGTLRATTTPHSGPQQTWVDGSTLDNVIGDTGSVDVASTTVSSPDNLARSIPSPSSDISAVATEQAGRVETSSDTQVSEPTSSCVQNQSFISEQPNVLPNFAENQTENTHSSRSWLPSGMAGSIMNDIQIIISRYITPSSSMPPTDSQSDGLSLPGTSGVLSSQAMNPEQAAARERLLPSERQALRQFNEYWESFSAEEKSKLEEYRGKCDDRDALVRALTEFIFTDEERRTQNCQGKSGLQKHDEEKLNKLRSVTFHLCPISTSRDTHRVERKEWTRLQGEIDTANRHFRQELKRRENRN